MKYSDIQAFRCYSAVLLIHSVYYEKQFYEFWTIFVENGVFANQRDNARSYFKRKQGTFTNAKPQVYIQKKSFWVMYGSNVATYQWRGNSKKMQEHIGAKSKFLCFSSFSKHFLVNQNFGYYIKIVFYEAISYQYRNNNATAH